MTLKQLVYLIALATVLMWGGWFWTLFNWDPQVSGVAGFLLFYFTLFLSLTGTISLLGLLARKLNKKYNIIFYTVALSFRQAIILSTMAIILLILQSQRWLKWWGLLILFVLAVAAETVVLYKQKKRIIKSVPIDKQKEISTSYTPAPKFEKRNIE